MYSDPTKQKLHVAWSSMRRRCTDPKHDHFYLYGGRGITVCAEWRTFGPFYDWAIQAGYRPGLTIERKNNDGEYSPENCCWIERAVQQKNTRRNRVVQYQGKPEKLFDLIERLGVDRETLIWRMENWPEDRWAEPVRGYRQ